jgi:hypothetical protein
VTSPSEEWWLSADLAAPDGCGLYGAMARRFERTRDGELSQLLRALVGVDAAVAAMVRRQAEALAVFQAWGPEHGVRLTCWQFSAPSVRAAGRHPAGGIGCVEWVETAAGQQEVLVYHWIDAEDGRRDSWRQVVRAGALAREALPGLLDEALAVLLGESPVRRAADSLEVADLGLMVLR